MGAVPTPAEVLMTGWFRFLGANIKGTPSMAFWRVAADLRVLRANGHFLALQEFRWPWYWRAARRVLRRARRGSGPWGSSPPFRRGQATPVRGATGVMWRRNRGRHVGTRVALMHEGEAKVTEDRYLRAARVEVDKTGLEMWVMSGHAVVGGDQPGDPRLRRQILDADLAALDQMLGDLQATGLPGIAEMDLNIRPGGPAYRTLRAILDDHHCRLHGDPRGVEYLFTWDGKDTRVEVDRAFQITTRRMNTDHEVRGIRARLVARWA